MLRFLKKCWLENCRKARVVERKMRKAKKMPDRTKLEEHLLQGRS